MSSRIITVKGDPEFFDIVKVIRALLNSSSYTYDTFLKKAIDECAEIVKTFEYDYYYTYKIFPMKVSSDTLTKLDITAINMGIPRSELIRRLFYAKVRGLC